MKTFAVLAVLFSFLNFSTVAYADDLCYSSEVDQISLPLSSTGRARLKEIEKKVDSREEVAEGLVLINCHAEMFHINMVQGLDWIKSSRDSSSFKKKSYYYPGAAGNFAKAAQSAKKVFDMYFENKEQTYFFVWNNIKPRYEVIVDSYREEGYIVARISYKTNQKAYNKLQTLLERT